ncbi:hypothetical protein KC19_10G037300 [Ceratodon purpureus]|uniref:Uncharacterized protein n=1 Tax=Ceratodon purpureus TaxID=3225 RepID=A0A8T0GGI7_CERPU|nr:hypothetical protein KC19_10G037300 [Ceratodon purpureus]
MKYAISPFKHCITMFHINGCKQRRIGVHHYTIRYAVLGKDSDGEEFFQNEPISTRYSIILHSCFGYRLLLDFVSLKIIDRDNNTA